MSRLKWHRDGYGELQPSASNQVKYDDVYYDDCVEYKRTRISRKLNLFRSVFVDNYWSGPVLDFGSAAGGFIEIHGPDRTYGYDIMPKSRAWLRSRDLYLDPWAPEFSIDAVSMWDVLGHIPDPASVLESIDQWLFVSLPCFPGRRGLERSPHYKPGERIWYFTKAGFCHWSLKQGFDVIGVSDQETLIGRKGMLTFALHRNG